MSTQSERNAAFLNEMGVGPIWTRRDQTAPAEQQPAAAEPAAAAGTPAAEAAPAAANPAPPKPRNEAVPTSAWDDTPAPAAAPAAVRVQAGPADIAQMDWAELRAAVEGCTRCGLCAGRKRTVFGVGDKKARWMFIGEAPGRVEDMQGEPFVGPAGKLLDNMLAAIGLARDANVYIANVLKCRPTGADGRDRPPTPEEVSECMPYLQRQIALVDPTVIVALGKSAALALLGLDPSTPVSSLRGTVHRHAGRPLIVTYHPAYLLRNPVDKRKTWADLCLAMSTYAAA
jgi:uracil-DNA glycosylase